MGGPTIFYFDFNSPYAYLAAERIEDLIPGAEWRPIAFELLVAQRDQTEPTEHWEGTGRRGRQNSFYRAKALQSTPL